MQRIALLIHCTVEPFGLSIGLGPSGFRSLMLDAKAITSSIKGPGNELLAVIREDGSNRDAGPLRDLYQESHGMLGVFAGENGGIRFSCAIIDGGKLVFTPLLSLDSRKILDIQMNHLPWSFLLISQSLDPRFDM